MTFPPRSVFLAFCLFAQVAHATHQEDLENLRKRLALVQQEFEKSNESKSEAADALRESERNISDTNRSLTRLALQQQVARKELHELQQRANILNKSMLQHQSELGRLLYQQYLDGGDQDLLKLLINNDDPNQISRDLRYYYYIAQSRAASLKVLRNSLANIQSVTEQVRDKSSELATLRSDEHKALQQLQRDKNVREHTLGKISRQLKQQRKEISRLQRNENQLSKLVEKLAHSLPDGGFAPFKSLKGKLALPVKGIPSNRYGAVRPESTLAWTGWFLRAAPDHPVKAIASGRTVYADWLRGFGNLLIIDHGQGYLSLYGNNETLYKQAGDAVQTGDTIASVGNSGGNADSGLYFELRFEGKPFDPNGWFRHREK